MSISLFRDILPLSDAEISEKIIETENKLFNLRFKKATRQNFKTHQMKYTKLFLAQLKTLLTVRLRKLKQKEKDSISN